MKMRRFITSHKGFTWLFVLIMIIAYQAYGNRTAWIYMGLHGTYGIFWVLKDRFFPDKRWERSVAWTAGLGIWAALTLYLAAPFLLISRGVEHDGWYLALCMFLFGVGAFLHFTADMQKFAALKASGEQLIQDGLFRHVRNPNYLGELLVYTSFAMLSFHWISFIVLAAFIGVYWIPSMIRKDHSLSRYPEFEEYKRRTKLLVPYLL